MAGIPLAICMHCSHIAVMKNITVRNVPDETRNRLAARAAGAGQSLQEYLLGTLNRWAETDTPAEVVARAQERKARSKTRVSAKKILRHRDAGRRD